MTSAQNREKLTPLPSCLQNVRTGSTPLSVRTNYIFRKIEVFCAKKCGRRLLWTAPKKLITQMTLNRNGQKTQLNQKLCLHK